MAFGLGGHRSPMAAMMRKVSRGDIREQGGRLWIDGKTLHDENGCIRPDEIPPGSEVEVNLKTGEVFNMAVLRARAAKAQEKKNGDVHS